MNILIIITILGLITPAAEAFDTAARREFSTDFSRRSVDPSEIRSGGPPKDGIPAVDDPQFVPVESADEWLGDREPVLLLRRDGTVKIYPLQILMWHEIVNDTIGSTPVTVTFCPLCNTGIAFDRRLDGMTLNFGTTGRLRFSNLIMYDRQSESWWQQADGQAIAGLHTGKRLSQIPIQRSSWKDAKRAFPAAQVLSRETGYNRAYGRNPYRNYDEPGSRPFLYDGPATPGRESVARVLHILHKNDQTVIAYEKLEQEQVLQLTLGDAGIVVFFDSATASALDSLEIASGRAVGSANAYYRRLDNRSLSFSLRRGGITDNETGSRWNVLGEAVSGPLKGKHLEPAVAADHFWFSAWAFLLQE